MAVAGTALKVGLLLALFAVPQAAALAQQGHPLVGSWSGDWGTSAGQRQRILLLLDYDGDQVTGVINPGPNPITLTAASLNAEDWTVRLEAAASESSGGVRYLIEGRIENLGSISERTIRGIWAQGDERGDFRIVLN
jgi:hypothetical protein